jgi:imidazolonepropionase-like amidohydrolase
MLPAAKPGPSLHVCLLVLLLACSTSDGNRESRTNSEFVALVGGTVYPSPDVSPIQDGVVLVRAGSITAVGRRAELAIPQGGSLLDCSGATVLAGFWNSHVHFSEPHWAGADTLPAAILSEQLRAMLARYGFVRVFDTGSWLENTLALRRRVESGEVVGPAILSTGPGFVAEGASPFYIRPARLPELRTPGDARVAVAARLAEGADAIKLFTASFASPTSIIPLPLPVIRAAAAEAHRQGRPVFAHPSNNAGLLGALEGGVDILAHTSPDGGPWSSEIAAAMVRANMALIPTLKLWKFELARKGRDSAAIVRFQSVAEGQLRAFVAAGGEVLFGTDVGYMTDYDPTDEFLAMHRAGMSFEQILSALTTAPATRFVPSAKHLARVEVGAQADLVVVEGDPAQDIGALARVRYAVRQGRVLYSAK